MNAHDLIVIAVAFLGLCFTVLIYIGLWAIARLFDRWRWG